MHLQGLMLTYLFLGLFAAVLAALKVNTASSLIVYEQYVMSKNYTNTLLVNLHYTQLQILDLGLYASPGHNLKNFPKELVSFFF